MARKIIQIAPIFAPANAERDDATVVFALCDDGTTWSLNLADQVEEGSPKWLQGLPIPQDEPGGEA